MLVLLPWYVYAVLSAVLAGVKSIVQKAELKAEHSLDYTVAFSLVAMVVALFLWPWVRWENLTGISVTHTYLASLFGAVAIWLGTKALRHLEISFVSPQTVFSTVFTLLFAYLLLGDKLTVGQLGGAAILVVGGVLLAGGAFTLPHHGHGGWWAVGRIGDLASKKKTAFFYEVLLLGSMVLTGLSGVFDKFALQRLDFVTFIFLISIFLFINHLVLYWAVVGNIRQIPGRVDHLGWLLVGIAAMTTLSRLTYAQALSMTELSLVIAIQHSAILVTTFLGGQLFKEKRLFSRMAVAVLMLVGMWLLVR